MLKFFHCFIDNRRRRFEAFKRKHRETIDIFFPEKHFWKRVLHFSIPIALQQMSTAILAIIDVSIISSLGENAVASVSLANQVSYVASLIAFGITSGASVYLSRSFGAKDPSEVKKNFVLMMFCSLLLNVIIAVISAVSPNGMLALYTDKPELIKSGSVYLLIVAPTFVMNGFFNGMASFFRSANEPTKPMITTMIAIVIKTLLTYILVYGFWIIPPMGIAGAALATLIGRGIEVAVYIVMLRRYKEKEYIFSFKDCLYINWKNLKQFLRDTYPVIFNESLWGLGLSAFSAIFGRMGAMEVSALSVAQQLENLCNSFFQGIGIGACVSVSHVIGESRYTEARHLAKQYAVSGLYVGIGIMLLMLSVNRFYVNTFFADLTPETRQVACWLVAIYAVYMPARSLASSMIMGVLRAGGDSKKAMFYDVLPIYLWSLPVGFLTGILLHWSIAPVLLLMQFKRVIKCVFAVRRMLSGRWLQPRPMDNAAVKETG